MNLSHLYHRAAKSSKLEQKQKNGTIPTPSEENAGFGETAANKNIDASFWFSLSSVQSALRRLWTHLAFSK